jgi:hypothetical protein
MLMNISRQLADWVNAVDALDEGDRATLADAGLSAEPVRAALDSEGGAFERQNMKGLGRPPMDQRMAAIIAELTRFETSLQTAPQPYR